MGRPKNDHFTCLKKVGLTPSYLFKLGYCLKLEQLYMDDNPIKDPPKHIFKHKLPEFLTYLTVEYALQLKSTRQEGLIFHRKDLLKGEEQSFRARVMVLGDEGKQRLVKHLTDDASKEDDRLDLTITNVPFKSKHGLLPEGTPVLLPIVSLLAHMHGKELSYSWMCGTCP